MPVITGAMILLRAENQIVGKANEIEFDVELESDVSEQVGSYHVDEVIYTGVTPPRVSFTIEREATKGLVKRGLWPDMTSDFNITNFKPLTLEIQDKASGAILHKVKGWKPTGKPIGFTKGRKSMYRVSGMGTRETEKD